MRKTTLKRITALIVATMLITSVALASINPNDKSTNKLGHSGESNTLGNSNYNYSTLGESSEIAEDNGSLQSLEMAMPALYGYNFSRQIYGSSITGTLNMDADYYLYSGDKPGLLDSTVENSLYSSSSYSTEWLVNARKLRFEMDSIRWDSLDTQATSVQYSSINKNGKLGGKSILDGYSISGNTVTVDLSKLNKLQEENPSIYIIYFDIWTSRNYYNVKFNVVIDPETIIPSIDFINGTGSNKNTDPENISIGFTEFSLTKFRDYTQEWVIKKADGTIVGSKSIVIDQASESAANQNTKEKELQNELTQLFKTLNKGSYTITLSGSATSTSKGSNYRIQNTLTNPFLLTKDAPIPDPVSINLEKYIVGRNAIENSEKGELYNDIKTMEIYDFSGLNQETTSNQINYHKIETSGESSKPALQSSLVYPGRSHYVLEVGPPSTIAQNLSYVFSQAETLASDGSSVIQTATLIDDYSSEIPDRFLSEFESIVDEITNQGRDYRLWRFQIPDDTAQQNYTLRMNSQISGVSLSPYIKTFTGISPQNLDALLLPDGNVSFPMENISFTSANTATSESWSRAADTIAYFSVGQIGYTDEQDNNYRVSQVYIVDSIEGLPDDPNAIPTNLIGPQPQRVGSLSLAGAEAGWSVNDYWSVTISKEHAGGVVVFYYEPKPVPATIDAADINFGTHFIEPTMKIPWESLTINGSVVNPDSDGKEVLTKITAGSKQITSVNLSATEFEFENSDDTFKGLYWVYKVGENILASINLSDNAFEVWQSGIEPFQSQNIYMLKSSNPNGDIETINGLYVIVTPEQQNLIKEGKAKAHLIWTLSYTP